LEYDKEGSLSAQKLVNIASRPVLDNNREDLDRPYIVTYSFKEWTIARRGLWKHIGLTYKGTIKRAKKESVALRAVAKTLVQDVDSYLLDSWVATGELANVHDRSTQLPDASKIRQDPGALRLLARFVMAYESNRTGEYMPKSKQAEFIENESQYFKNEAEDLEVQEVSKRAFVGHDRRLKEWKKQVLDVYGHTYVLQLLDEYYEAEQG